MQAINSTAINTSPELISIYSWEYSFDGFNLHDKVNITLKSSNNDDLTEQDISLYDFAYNHGGWFSSRYYRGREIRFIGSVKAETEQLFQEYMDTLKKWLSKAEWILNVKGRKIKATLSKMAYNRNSYNITWSPVELTFKTSDAFWSEWAESIWFTWITWDLQEEVSYIWTAPSSPTWYFAFQSGASITNISITHNWVSFIVPVSATSWDVVLIDGKNKTVLKNGVEIDFTGVFPEFTEYSNPFIVDFTGTVNVDVTLIFDKYFL